MSDVLMCIIVICIIVAYHYCYLNLRMIACYCYDTTNLLKRFNVYLFVANYSFSCITL
jgi:hypothetical protein